MSVAASQKGIVLTLYTAGELNEPFQTIPASRWLEGSQWHALTYLGSNWSQRDTRYPTEKWVKWVIEVVAHEGAVTLDVGLNWDPQAGPIGALAEAQVNQVPAIQTALSSSAAPTMKCLQRAANGTSFFGSYADKLLIPQLRELAGEYGVDGTWVDGECWASVPDYSPVAIEAFKKSTGIADVPRKPGDPHWFEFLEFNRQVFREYLNHYHLSHHPSESLFRVRQIWVMTAFV